MVQNNYFILALAVVAGITIGTGVIHLAIGFRRRRIDALYVSFSVFAMAYGFNIIAVIAEYKAVTVEAYLRADLWIGILVSTVFISLIWFVAFYTDTKPRIFLYGLTAVFLVIVTLHTFRPTRLFAEVSGIFFHELPWGETIAIIEATETIWLTVFLLAELCVLAFIFYAGIQQFRRGDRTHAVILLVGMSLLVATLAFDIFFIESGAINFVFLSDFGFLPIAAMMAVILTTHVLETEAELSKYQSHLEELVEQRTQELKKINQQYADEIIERQKAEMELRQTNRRVRAMLESTPESVLLTDPEGIILDLNEVAANRLEVNVKKAIGRNVFDFLGGEVAQDRRQMWDRLLETMEPVQMDDAREGRQYSNVLYPVLNDVGNIVSISIFAQDITDQMHAEASLKQRIKELDSLIQIAHSVTTIEDLPAIMSRVAELIMGLFEARYTHIITQDSGEDSLMVLNGFDREQGSIEQFPLDLSLRDLTYTQQLFTSGESQILTNVQELPLHDSIATFIRAHDVQHMLLLPLLVGDHVEGIMVVSRDTADQVFQNDDVKLGEIIAADVSLAIENFRLQRQEKETAAAEERTRIARDLHDAVTQTIYSAGLIAEALPRVWERDIEEGRLGLEKLRRLLHGALSEMRILLFELRPESTEVADLSTLLRHLGNALGGRTRVDVIFDFDESEPIPQDVKVVLYRIAQEAMNNIEKHTEATTVEIKMNSDELVVCLLVRDDGKGFDPQTQEDQGLGLSIMEERAKAVGVDLDVQSQIGEGTEVIASWARE